MLSVGQTSDTSVLQTGSHKPSLTSAAEQLTGMLWYQMLAAMDENGFDTGALGAGGSEFQSLFLWHEAETSFGKYDGALLGATQRQLGGVGGMAPQTPPPVAQALATAAPVAETPAPVAPVAGGLLTQATSFAQAVWPQITEAAAQLNVPPVAVLAQAALETGWGASAPGNNLFGIKAVDGQTGSARATHEMVDGVLTAQTSRFRDYASPAASVADYTGLIQNGYETALGQSTVSGFAQALQAGGYATDTSYATKIVNIAQSPLMAQVLAHVQAAAGGTSSPSSTTSKADAP